MPSAYVFPSALPGTAILYFVEANFEMDTIIYIFNHHPIINQLIIMERSCLDCGKALVGRADKKFCDDSCRNNYNNHLKSDDTIVIKKINLILKKNRTLLVAFNPNGKIKVQRKKLAAAGFNFEYHTHSYKTQTGSTYYFCYEYGFLILNEEEVLLVKREEKLWLS